MGFFKKSRNRSYDLFSSYAYYVPDVVGVVCLLLMFLLGMLLGSCAQLLFAFLTSTDIAMSYGMLISYPLMFIPPMLYASAKSRRNEGFDAGIAIDSAHWGRYNGWQMAFIVTALTLACSFMTDGINALMPPVSDKLKSVLEAVMNGPVWVSFISVAIFAPFFEEWLCRGMILRGLLQKYSPATAICISALIFALIHGNLWQGVAAFLLGCVFGYVYYRTGSLKLTMLMHCVNNTFALVLSNIPALRNFDTMFDAMHLWSYLLVMACAIVIAFFGIVALRSIPLAEGKRCNCDSVEPLNSEIINS